MKKKKMSARSVILIFSIIFMLVLLIAESARSERVDCVLAEMDGKMIKFSDIELDRKLQESVLPSIFQDGKSVFESFVDESVLAFVGMERLEKTLSSSNRNFGLYVEKRDEWLRDTGSEFGDTLYVWAGKTEEFFREIVMLGKITKEDGKDIGRMIEDWRDQLLVNYFFPNESRQFRKKDIDRLIKITAETLGVDQRRIEKRFLKRAFAKLVLDEIVREAEAKAQVVPADIRKYCADNPLECCNVFYKKVKNKELAEWLVLRLTDGGFEEAGISDFKKLDSAASLLSDAREKIIEGEYNFWLEINGEYLVFKVKNLSFVGVQERFFEKIKEAKKNETISASLSELREKYFILIK